MERPKRQMDSENVRRKNVIGLDDLLADHYNEKGKIIEKEFKRAKAPKKVMSDSDDDNIDELKFHQTFEQCQLMIEEISGEDEVSVCGINVFGFQHVFPPINFPDLGSCKILQSFMNNEINSLVELNHQNVEVFFEGLLVNGWLPKFVFAHGNLEKPIAAWTCNLLFYSTREDLRKSACDLWVAVLSYIEMGKMPLLEIHWHPSYHEIKNALVLYGFHFDITPESSYDGKDEDHRGPPQNIRSWIRFVSACCQLRSKHPFFSRSEAEELVEIILCLFLCPQLQGLLLLLHECWISLVSYFEDGEWNDSCNKIAKFLACWVPRDMNCLQLVECISKVNARSQCLRSAVAYEILIIFFENKITDAEEILRALISINVKEKGCDLSRVYIYMVLTDNWLLNTSLLDEKPLISEMWGLYLRNCSFQIGATDLRCYAAKVRTKATYLLQGVNNPRVS